ncbi:MAG: amidohydrolase [Chloroflexi bacterium]|nr:amidohydrolase [Chloroflexota bacterium]
MSQEVERLLAQWGEELIRLRREFHAHPERSFEEVRTAASIAGILRELGMEVREGVGGTGVVGRLYGRRAGRVIALRADIDGLPIQEANEVDYVSQNSGVMHACGHDGHSAIMLVVARILNELRATFDGEARFIFQPAEEIGSGAEAMMRDGVYGDPKPEAALGLHLWNGLPTGVVGVKEGPLFANTSELNVTIRGYGGHGAMPHLSVDPVVVSAYVITALQTMLSREVPPLHSAVLTIGRIQGGSAFNVIPSDLFLQGTVRTFDGGVQALFEERVPELIKGIAGAMRATAEVDFHLATPAVVNDPKMAALVRDVAVSIVGERRVRTPDSTMGGDDMAIFLNASPGCYFFVGTANPAKDCDRPHHHPQFNIDEDALPIGVRILAQAALELLRR